jgi:molybdopterin converting factor small subunit
MATRKVELYGTARVLTGCKAVEIPVADPVTVREVLLGLGRQFPLLGGPVLLPDFSGLSAGYAVNLNGLAFVSDPAQPVRDGDVLLLLPAAAGGAPGRAY